MKRFTWNRQLGKQRAAFALLVVFAALLQNTRGVLPALGSARTFLMVPLCVAIAMAETSIAAMLFGVFGGVLLDSCAASGDGFYAVTLCIICFVCSIIVSLFLQNNLPACLLLNAGALLLCAFVHWFLFVFLKGYTAAGDLVFRHYLFGVLYSMIFAPLAFWLIRAIRRAAAKR